MKDNKMHVNIINGDTYNFTYILKEYEIIEKHYTPSIINKEINITIDCSFENDEILKKWIKDNAESCTGRRKLNYDHITIYSDINILSNFNNCILCDFIIKQNDNEVILKFNLNNKKQLY